MIYSLGLLVGVVGSALAAAPMFADAFGLIKIAVAILGAAILWTSVSAARIPRTGIGGPLAACAAVMIGGLLFSVDPQATLVGTYGQPFHGITALAPAILIFYAVAAERWRWPNGPAACAAAVAAISGIACAAQLGGLVAPPFDFQGGRAIGTMGSPVFLGATVATCLPVTLWLGTRSWAAAAAAALGFLALAAAGSRGPWIAAAGRVRPRGGHLAAAAAVLAILAAFSGVMGKLSSDSGRVEVWRIAVKAGLDKPILGWGPDTFPLAMRALKTESWTRLRGVGMLQASAHCDLLQAWATTGITGLAAYVWLWAALLAWLWRFAQFDALVAGYWGTRIAEDDRAAAVFGSMIALFVAAKFNPVPPTAIYVAAALAGSVLIDRSADFRAPRLAWALAIGVAISTLALSGRQIAAEALYSFGNMALRARDVKAGADLIRQANELAPWEVTYAARRCELIYGLVQRSVPELRRDFTKRALRVSGEVLRARPHDPASYELMATSELFASELFGQGLARASVKSSRRAVDLDPFFEFSLVRLAQSSTAIGDHAGARAAAEKLARVRARKS